MTRRLLFMVAPALLLAGVAVWFSLRGSEEPVVASTRLQDASTVMYKSPTCGCCDSYADVLASRGVKVDVEADDEAVAQAKRQYGVPSAAVSCHTIVMEGYVVEGHVPLEAIEALLDERPDIAGIALPGMPPGSPGMPGTKQAPFEVLQFGDGSLSPFLSL